jgi:hypothetical protein
MTKLEELKAAACAVDTAIHHAREALHEGNQ